MNVITFSNSQRQWQLSHNVLQFGDKPAPAMAQVALRKTAEEGELEIPRAAQAIKYNSCMDDILDSVTTNEEATELTTA